MDLLVIGCGYVGLVAAACFSFMGHLVVCLDVNTQKIEGLRHGQIPIYEPNLQELVRRNSAARRLQFTTDYASAVSKAAVCFIAVDTPMGSDGNANLQYVLNVASSIGTHMNAPKIIVIKSTVPVGTSEIVRQTIQKVLDERNVKINFSVVSNPEFLKEGDAINDFMKPDRVLIGSSDENAIATMKAIYAPFMLNHNRLIVMDNASAEMTKYAANAMLALRISFMNELSGLCEHTGADICKVRIGIGSDNRIGYNFLYAGPGYGGSCFPKDIRSLSAQAQRHGYDTPLIDAISTANQRQKAVIANKIFRYFSSKEGVTHITLGILGLSFKPDTDDIRESPALIVIDELLEVGAQLRLYDPAAMENVKKLYPNHPNITFCHNEIETAKGADAIILMTEWKQFRLLDLKQMLSHMCGNAFFDARNQFDPQEIAAQGFDYISIGRPQAFAKEEKGELDDIKTNALSVSSE